jgi:hypothetical protein
MAGVKPPVLAIGATPVTAVTGATPLAALLGDLDRVERLMREHQEMDDEEVLLLL